MILIIIFLFQVRNYTLHLRNSSLVGLVSNFLSIRIEISSLKTKLISFKIISTNIVITTFVEKTALNRQQWKNIVY